MGGMTSPEAIQESQLLGLDLIAKWYLVMVAEFELYERAEQFDYSEYQQVEQIISRLTSTNPDILLAKTGVEKQVLIIKGDTSENLAQESRFLTELIRTEVENKTNCSLRVGIGSPQDRIGHIYRSFAEALANLSQDVAKEAGLGNIPGEADKAELLELDKSALENFLRYGAKEEFDDFFQVYIQPLNDTALQSYLVKNYIFVDIVLTVAKFVHQLGGNVDQVIPEINLVETLLLNVKTFDQLREETRQIFAGALAFRDSQPQNQYKLMIHQAKKYIEAYYTDPNLSLNDVATEVNFSPSHFSVIFSREMGMTFKDYLINIRMEKAKELLRTTPLKSFEISSQIGYNDPHYFSYVFKKHTNLSPKQFRLLTKTP
jgi:two-component system response regulator YesN